MLATNYNASPETASTYYTGESIAVSTYYLKKQKKDAFLRRI